MSFRTRSLLRSALLIMTLLLGLSTAELNAQEEASGGFYEAASAAASMQSEILARDPAMNEAGAAFGFMDDQLHSKSYLKQMTAELTNASSTISYAAPQSQGSLQYLLYGKALRQLGLDKMTSLLDPMIRLIGGFGLGLAYLFAVGADLAIGLVVSLLRLLNPFALLVSSRNIQAAGGYLEGARLPEPAAGIMNGLAGMVSELYDILVDLGWLVVPVFLAATVAGLLLFQNRGHRRHSAWDGLKHMGIRIFFLVLGVPLLGSLYTAALAQMPGWEQQNVSSANHILSGTLLDFESWASRTALALPKDTQIVVEGISEASPGGTVSASASTELRKLARKINYLCDARIAGNPDDSQDSLVDTTPGTAQAGFEYIQKAISLIQKYMFSETYTGGDYESEYKALRLQETDFNTSAQKYRKAFEKALEPDNYKADAPADSRVDFDGRDMVLYNDSSDGFLQAQAGESGRTFTYTGSQAGRVSGTRTLPSNGLSSLSMYNYLTTEFGESTAQMYSSNRLLNQASGHQHYSVNTVGTGLTGLLYYLNSVVLLGAAGCLGYFFGVGMLAGCLKRNLNFLLKLPFALGGNMKAISQVITVVAVMLVEVVGTLFLFALGSQLLLSLNQIFETSASSLSLGSDMADFLVRMTVLCLGIFINITFCRMMIKFRGHFLQAVEEYADEFIRRIFESHGGVRNAVPAGSAGSYGSGQTGANNVFAQPVLAGAGAHNAQRAGDLTKAMAREIKTPAADAAKAAKKAGTGLAVSAGKKAKGAAGDWWASRQEKMDSPPSRTIENLARQSIADPAGDTLSGWNRETKGMQTAGPAGFSSFHETDHPSASLNGQQALSDNRPANGLEPDSLSGSLSREFSALSTGPESLEKPEENFRSARQTEAKSAPNPNGQNRNTPSMDPARMQAGTGQDFRAAGQNRQKTNGRMQASVSQKPPGQNPAGVRNESAVQKGAVSKQNAAFSKPKAAGQVFYENGRKITTSSLKPAAQRKAQPVLKEPKHGPKRPKNRKPKFKIT